MRCALLLVSLVTPIVAPAIAQPDAGDKRKEVWKKTLDGQKFQFSQSDASMLFALSQFTGDCEIHMIYQPKKRWGIKFKFVRGEKEVLVVDGHKGSVFRTVENVLYFAHFSPATFGCTVTAHDLTTGKKLWETKLNAVGATAHSAYLNQVTMGVAQSQVGGAIVSITGRESFGDYIEILDRKTGAILGHKIYRKGFGDSK